MATQAAELSPMLSEVRDGLEPALPVGETRPAPYDLGTAVHSRGPWAQIVGFRNVLCIDGRRRNTVRVALSADTFFSHPASVKGN